MALFLHRLGRWCATHAKSVVALWLVVLIGVGVGAATLGRPLTSEIQVPGSEFERVLDQLGDEVPEAAGGFGTVVLHSDEGEFTPKQRKEIQKVFAKWEDVDEVKGVVKTHTQPREEGDEDLDV